MLRTATAFPDKATLEAEVAVVGAGPLGIVLALELARNGHHVVLIESGQKDPAESVQDLSETVGQDPYHAPMELAVRRQLGGTSNTWGGRCVPFDPVDFDRRPWSTAPWPISYDALAAYYQRAARWCVCGDAEFDATAIPELATKQLVPGLPDGRVRTTTLERWSLPTNFWRVYGDEAKRHETLDLVTDLTCTKIVCTAAGDEVDHLVGRSTKGSRVDIRARAYVLATGGLEATRLLFASDDKHPGGIGNHAGHLGRWYMAHVEGRVATICLTTPPEETIWGHERDREGVYVRRRFTFSRDWQHEAGLPNAAIWFVNPELGDARHRSAVLSMVYLMLRSPLGGRLVAEGIRRAHLRTTQPTRVRDHLANLARGGLPAARFALTFGWQRYLRPGRKIPGFFFPSAANTYPLAYHGEHRPHFESFVAPTAQRDALGLPRLRTHLHFSNEDVASVRRALEELDSYIREHRVGSLTFHYPDIESAVRNYLHGAGGYHQTGITRMSERPEDGVVDGQLAVHGFTDLFIASTSTLPRSSQANPTFVGVALALRLADHLHLNLGGIGKGRVMDADLRGATP